MKDIVQEALALHTGIAEGDDGKWNVAFVNKDMVRGTIKALGDGKYVILNPHGPVYFSADKVIYLYPVL